MVDMATPIEKVYSNLTSLLAKLHSNIRIINEDRVKTVEQHFEKKWYDMQRQVEKTNKLRKDFDLLKVIQDLETLENM